MRFFFLLLVASSLSLAQTPKAGIPAFKESGSVMAPITIELYTDFQCPHCREFTLTALPQLINDFVKTSKVRLIHRDFPLPQFQFSRMALKYANAAGSLGYYDAVAKQLFEAQPEWSRTGDVDGTVAKVVPPADMVKVREMVKSDSRLDDALAKDIAMGNADRLQEVPSIVITYKGKRETTAGIASYMLLKSYLTEKLSQ